MQVIVSHDTVMGHGVVLGEVICQVVDTETPVHKKLTLVNTVANPIEAHIDGFRTTLADGGVSNTSGGGVVGLEWSRWLWVAEFKKGCAKDNAVLAIDKEGTNFQFSGRGHDIA